MILGDEPELLIGRLSPSGASLTCSGVDLASCILPTFGQQQTYLYQSAASQVFLGTVAMATNWAAEFNGEEDDDEALRRAIALSLGEDAAGDTTSSDRDDSVRPGTQTQESLSSIKHDTKDASEFSTQMTTPDSSQMSQNAFSALGMDRKKMEQERLARLQKRKAGEAGISDSQLPTQRLKLSKEPSTVSTMTKKPEAQVPKASGGASEQRTLESSKSSSSDLSKGLKFPQGVVRKTWALGQPRQGDDIKIEEVLQKEDLELAVLSSYQWDEDWLTSKLNFRKTKVILIAFAADEATVSYIRLPLDL